MIEVIDEVLDEWEKLRERLELPVAVQAEPWWRGKLKWLRRS